MLRSLSLLAALALTAVVSSNASAQSHPIVPGHGGIGQGYHHFGYHGSGNYQSHRFDHDYWHHEVHVPDIAQLDTYSDQLAKVARHLHEDAHQLSQDYEHSEAIEHYVDRVDRLQKHMHEILHEAAEQGVVSTVLISHVKSDVRSVASLVSQLDGQLSHQAKDGARTADFHAISHMRQIIASEMRPLLQQINVELYGHVAAVQRQPIHHAPYTSHRWRW